MDNAPSSTPNHGRHWELARYELPLTEVERKVGNRRVTDIVVGDSEKLAYVHRFTGKRVEFSRPRVDNMAAALEEADAKWQCELAFAESNRREKTSNVIGHIELPRPMSAIAADWRRRARDPQWVKWPTKLEGVPGAFGGRR